MPSPRAIIVDDSPTLRSVLRADLEGAGWVVTEESDGEAAAISALLDPPDVVISDIWMPGINGLQLCRLLSEEPTTRSLPVVLLTGSGDRRARFWASRSGAAAFVGKAELRTIPKLIATLHASQPSQTAQAKSAPRRNLRRADVARKLSDLLDNALFHTVFAREVQDLAASSTTHEDLVRLFSALLGEVLPFAWLTIALPWGGSELDNVPEPHRTAVSSTLMSGERPLFASGDSKVAGCCISVHPLVHAGEPVGRLIVALQDDKLGPDRELLDTCARALAVPIRLMNLLAEGRMLACTDPLTGLPNRRHGELVLAQSVAASERVGQPTTVAFVDIDRFKAINDEHGHAVGDQVLAHVAQILKSTMRKSDVAVRWGGEEFVLLLTNTALVGARIALERIRSSVELNPLAVNGRELVATVSIGLAISRGEAIGEWLTRADTALYRAKARGRNRIEVAL